MMFSTIFSFISHSHSCFRSWTSGSTFRQHYFILPWILRRRASPSFCHWLRRHRFARFEENILVLTRPYTCASRSTLSASSSSSSRLSLHFYAAFIYRSTRLASLHLRCNHLLEYLYMAASSSPSTGAPCHSRTVATEIVTAEEF